MANRAASAESPSLATAQDAISIRPKSLPDRMAFAGLFLFTLLLYIRPNEILPEVLGEFPLVKIVAIATLATYAASRVFSSKRLIVWPFEMKMLALIVLLGLVFIPVAVSPQSSIDTLTDSFFKVVTIFVLMVNLVDDRERLRLMIKLVVICGAFIAIGAIKRFLTGDLDITHVATGDEIADGSIFANTNELAMALDLLLPLAVVMALTSKGRARLMYFACAGLIAGGVVLTFSRGGFLGLIAIGGVILWKAGKGRRGTTVMAAAVLFCVFVVAMPGGYSDRLFTIFRTHEDPTNSAQERQALLMRAIEVAAYHPVIGVGIGNFPIYSLKGKVAHNSYIEIAAELGVAGLMAYLAFMFAPLGALKRIERQTQGTSEPEFYYLSVGLQAMIAAYLVCSLFASSQYYWYLYYTVAYAVSLKRIYAAERAAASGQWAEPFAEANKPAVSGGALWESVGAKTA